MFLITVMFALVGVLIFSGCAKPAPAPSPAPAPAPAAGTIKIGVMYPLTGPIAMTGKRMVDAAKFAFEQAGWQVNGKKIEVIVADSGEPEPTTCMDNARKLVEFDKISMLVGPLTTVGKLTVADYMAGVGVPQVATHFNVPEMSKYQWSIMSGGSTHQMCGTMGNYAYQKMGLKTVTGLTFETGDRVFFLAFKDGFEKAGGKVIQEQYTPRPCPDFAPYLANLKDADAMAAWVDGADGIRFLTQYHEFGIRKKMPLVAAFFGSFFEPYILHVIPPAAADAMIGEKCATSYTSLLETDVNKKFVQDIKAKFGYVPSEADSGAYLGAQVALKALQATKGDTTPEKIRQAILGLDFESSQGRIRFDQQTRFPIRDVYIIKIDKIAGEYEWVPVYTYKDVPPAGL